MAVVTVWGEDLVRALCDLAGRGFSASQIARELGIPSRNAVVGKLHRLKVPLRRGRGDSSGSRDYGVPARKRKPMVPRARRTFQQVISEIAMPLVATPVAVAPDDIADEGVDGPGILTVMAALATDDCRWPIGDPRQSSFRFCQQPALVVRDRRFPYCAGHCQMAYQPPAQRA